MSSLTNICEGDFARQLDIFKEEQAKSGTPARGRQALLMIHKHFSTSRKHGAVYDIEDRMAVTLVNDDLRGFITRWDAVIAGMTSEPDTMWKQAYFHNAIKNFKPLSHDLAVYDRTPEGEPNRSYELLMKAARDYLERKRLEKMRQATKKSVSGKRDAAPAPNRPPSAGKPQGICYDFQAGKCTRGKDCRYKHEKSDKGKGGGKKGKSRSKSRGTSRSLSPGSRNQVCKFWKAGKCQRGNECAFQHPPKPAAPSTKGDKRGKSQNKKKKNKKKGDRSRSSSRGSNSSRGSQSLKDKGGNHLPLARLQFAWCALWWWLQWLTLRPVLIACRKASPLRSFSTSILPCQLHPIALFHVGATLKSSKFPLSMIAIWIHAMPSTELTIQFASQRMIVVAKRLSNHVRVMPYLLHRCCSQLSSGSCMGNLANATSHVTVISAFAIAFVPTWMPCQDTCRPSSVMHPLR